MRSDSLATILIAEDNDGHSRLLQRGLKDAGAQNPVIRFRDGVEAWAFISGKSEPCLDPAKRYLLFLDIRMPNMDGIEVLRRLKADRRFRHIPVIMLTTSDDPEELRRCRELGCDKFSIKPIAVEEFAQIFGLPLGPGSEISPAAAAENKDSAPA